MKMPPESPVGTSALVRGYRTISTKRTATVSELVSIAKWDIAKVPRPEFRSSRAPDLANRKCRKCANPSQSADVQLAAPSRWLARTRSPERSTRRRLLVVDGHPPRRAAPPPQIRVVVQDPLVDGEAPLRAGRSNLATRSKRRSLTRQFGSPIRPRSEIPGAGR